MALEARITEDMKAALKAGDKPRLSTLRLLRAALKNASIEAGGALDDDAVVAVLNHQAKQRRDAIEQFTTGGRDDLAAGERAELAVIEGYLPRRLTGDEIEAEARRVIAEVGAETPRDMGRVMKPLMAALAGRADGKAASEIVRRLLSDA